MQSASVQTSQALGRTYLLEALVRLGAKKKLSRITVTELCKKAGVNRTTFYKYFQDIPDMFNAVADEFLQSTFYKPLKENLGGRPTNEVMASVLDAMQRDRDLTLLILKNVEFESVHHRMFQELTTLWPAAVQTIETRSKLHMAYFYGGSVSFLRQWLSEEDRISAKDAADDLQILINQALNLSAKELKA